MRRVDKCCFASLSSFLTISLCMIGHYFSHRLCSILCRVFIQLGFFMCSCGVSPMSFSADLYSFSKKLLVKFQHVLCTPLSCCLHSVVFPAGLPSCPSFLNILISAELSLLSSFCFTAQHSEPNGIAGCIAYRVVLCIYILIETI